MLKILLPFFLISTFHYGGGYWQKTVIRTSNVQLEYSKTSFSCGCTPDYAGEDKVTCKKIPTESVQIGCTLSGVDPICLDLCFLWSPATGLNPADNMKSDPFVNPKVTTTYSVIVKQVSTGMIIDTFDVTVFVVEMELILYKPKVIAGNTTTPANPILGPQTFVNLDNDDDDVYYDNDALESPLSGVSGGDDELVRAELRLKPVDLPDKLVRLIATQGAGNIKVWENETKSGSEYLLNTDVALSLDGAFLKKDLWIEGISPHTIQKGTRLKMTYKGVDCGVDVPLTIIGVDNITWVGVGNSALNTNILDADPNYVSPSPLPATWPSAVRVFPDARAPAYATPLDFVKLEVTLSVTPVENLQMYVRSFDVDDPTNNTSTALADANFLTFIDPNDNPSSPVFGFYEGTSMGVTYTNHNDNRTASTKSGVFAGQIGNSAVIAFSTASPIATIDFPSISAQPGDNYRVVINGDQDFLENLENLDSRDGYRIVDKNVLLPGPSPLEILFPLKYASPVLTIWRFLHVEGDSMPAGFDAENELLSYFNDFSPNGNILNLSQSTNDLRLTFDNGSYSLFDPSAITTDPAPCTGAGRFQNGNLTVLNGGAGIAPNIAINTNTDHSVALGVPLDLTNALCTFSYLDPVSGILYSGTGSLMASPTKSVVGISYTWKLKNLILNPAGPGTTLSKFIGGDFKINSAFNVKIIGANNALATLTTDKFSLKVLLRDDDVNTSMNLPHSPLLTDLPIYNSSYLKIVDLGTVANGAVIYAPSDVNVGDDLNDFNQVAVCNQSVGFENAAFWCVHVVSSWQGSPYFDNDGDIITPGSPSCPPAGSSSGIELAPLAGHSPSAQHTQIYP